MPTCYELWHGVPFVYSRRDLAGGVGLKVVAGPVQDDSGVVGDAAFPALAFLFPEAPVGVGPYDERGQPLDFR